MITRETTCKFCKKPITVKIDPTGLEFCKNSGMDLMSMASCNRCADLRTEKINLQTKISRACAVYSQVKPNKPPEEMNKKQRDTYDLTARKISHLVGLYGNMITRWTGFPVRLDEQWVEAMMDRPDQVYSILQHMWPERERNYGNDKGNTVQTVGNREG